MIHGIPGYADPSPALGTKLEQLNPLLHREWQSLRRVYQVQDWDRVQAGFPAEAKRLNEAWKQQIDDKVEQRLLASQPPAAS